MSRILTLGEIQDDYARGICEHIENPGYFSTLTFPRSFWKPCPGRKNKQYSEFVIGLKLVRQTVGRLYVLVNDQCAGKPTRPKNRNLRIATIIEGLKSTSHIHMVTEDHHKLNKMILRGILLQASPFTSPKAIKVKHIYDLQGLGEYLVKEVNPDALTIRIELFGPQKQGGKHD